MMTTERSAERPGELRAAQPPPASAVQRVLIVDDNVDAAESLAALLEVLGHQTIVLHDGANAIDAVAKERPDLVLLDIGLPGLDGYEIARRLRRTPGVEGTRLVACTGYGREDDIRRINEAGFDQHLIKPVGATALERVLRAGARGSSPRVPIGPARTAP